jgi:uncharacterized RDD family membrane protein YckC
MQVTCPNCQQVLQFSGKRPAFCAYCGKALPAPAAEATVGFEGPPPGASQDGDPSEVGGYRLLRLIGEGGMGRVYEAEEIAGGRRVALKLISAAIAASSAAVERFRREGRLTSGVSHPRCVFIHAADEAHGRPYIVMELMPGTTLQDLLDREGPMPVEQALTRILDVIEGLREAHRLGVVHRDVKPSNCFLDAEGRVKIGDFGLSKSLIGSDALTRTGTFIGTPLFASPEQIKGEAVGPQSDVYSVAATLYCLLTGKAPFQGGDPAATLARIVSDPAPPMRSRRRDLPAALDQAVLRGLERDQAKRWRSLDEFQATLVPFLPGRLSIGGLGMRFAAFVIDYAVLVLLSTPFMLAAAALTGGGAPWDPHMRPDQMLFQHLIGLLVFMLYFGGCEVLWGWTPGKRWLGLRVCTAKAGERPGVAAAALRTGLFFLLLNLSTIAVTVLLLSGQVDPSSHNPVDQMRLGCLASATVYPLMALGIVLILCTMRARNGYRGLHELLSGTRVVRLPDVVRRRAALVRDLLLGTTLPDGLPARIGAFEVQGVLPASGRGRVLLGQDPSLGRRVWIWLRPTEDAPLAAARRDLSRTTRLRWLAGGREEGPHPEAVTATAGVLGVAGEPAGLSRRDQPGGSPGVGHQWDAFLAPDGGPLMAVAAERMSWGETRQMLGQLADELADADADGTLPATLGLGQVWVRPDGQSCLLDTPVGPAAADDASPLSLLAGATLLALRGTPPEWDERPAGVGVPLPGHAVAILNRLLGAGKPYADVREFRSALAAAADKPAETGRPRRLAHLAVLTAFLSFGLCSGIFATPFFAPIVAAFIPFHVKEAEAIRARLQEVAAQDAAAAQAEDPLQRRLAEANAGQDAQLTAALDQEIDRARQEYEARFNALNWAGRSYAVTFEQQMEDAEKQQNSLTLLLPPASQPYNVRAWASTEAYTGIMARDITRGLAWLQTIMVLFWPVIWIVWAFLFRGGLTFRMMGLSLVRGNGRPALRVQCAWRALLVWAPVVGLGVASVWLEAQYWLLWPGAGADAWLLWASSTAWWTAVALLPLYVAVAVWLPQRSLHDQLAGTYLVPR